MELRITTRQDIRVTRGQLGYPEFSKLWICNCFVVEFLFTPTVNFKGLLEAESKQSLYKHYEKNPGKYKT